MSVTNSFREVGDWFARTGEGDDFGRIGVGDRFTRTGGVICMRLGGERDLPRQALTGPPPWGWFFGYLFRNLIMGCGQGDKDDLQ